MKLAFCIRNISYLLNTRRSKMDILLEFSSTSSEISQDFYPIINLSPNSKYVLGLYSLYSYNSLRNILKGKNDLIQFEKGGGDKPSKFQFQIPPGSYEIKDLGEYIKKLASPKGINFELTVNTNTTKVEMTCDHSVIFSPKSIRQVIGFQKEKYAPGAHIAEKGPQIISVNVVNVECNIIGSSFRQGKRSNTLYTFYPDVPTGYKLIERPKNILFLPVTTQEVSNITLRLTDQKGNLIDFREEITIHLILRELT